MATNPTPTANPPSNPPSNPPTTSSNTTTSHPPPAVPLKVTTSSSPTYIDLCARSNQLASLTDPLTLLFQAEKLPPHPTEPPLSPSNTIHPSTSHHHCTTLRTRLTTLPTESIQRMIYTSSITRMTSKCHHGTAFIAEAANFAAVTCWEAQYAPPPPEHWETKYGPQYPDVDLSGMVDGLVSNGVPMSRVIAEKPVFAEFWMEMERAKYRYLYPLIWRAARERKGVSDANGVASTVGDRDHLKYWYICLTSRNPAVQPPVPGAVRAVIQPIAKRVIEEEGVPAVWILAANKRARDVYGYFGFRVVHEIVVGKDESGEDLRTWCMIYTRDGMEKPPIN